MNSINKSQKQKSNTYFENQAFNDIMTKYQRANRGSATNKVNSSIGIQKQQ